ncbi:MAG TPA: hypothetical protein VH916_04680 [Dehalococcoidia bacterium]|jgi:dipeptidyl aminopeptidase/acylaminoacyl peptidase
MTAVRRRSGIALAALLLFVCVAADAPWHGALAQSPRAVPQVNATAFAGLGKLAFVRDGTLYALDGTTGVLTTLSGAQERVTRPSWSPDGAWVAYLDVANSDAAALHLVHADGSANHMPPSLPSAAGSPAFQWSPVADTLAVSDGGLWLVPADGAATLLVAGAVERADWSSDGSLLAYTTDGRRDPSGIDGLWTVAAAGGQPDLQYAVTHSGRTGVAEFGWIGNPPRILFTLDPAHSASFFADGGWLYSLAPDSDLFTPLAPTLFYDDWRSAAPDGRSLAIVAGGGREAGGGKRVVSCDLVRSNLGCTALPVPNGMESVDPAWSPDGLHLAEVQAPDLGPVGGFASDADRNAWLNAHALVVVQPDGSQPLQLSPAGEAVDSPRWSRDGRTILYFCGAARGVCLVPGDGSGPPVQVVDGLSGLSGPFNPGPIGYYGHLDPALVLDWWQPGG